MKTFDLEGIDRVGVRQALTKFGFTPESVQAVDRAVDSHKDLLEVVKRLRAQHHAFLDETHITDDRFHLRLMEDTDEAIAKAEGTR